MINVSIFTHLDKVLYYLYFLYQIKVGVLRAGLCGG